MTGRPHPASTAPPAGAIEGVAEDVQRRPLPGVRLILRTTKGRTAKQATSGPDGRYRFVGIAAGDYSISGVKEGFATAATTVRSGPGSAFPPI
jgi:Carboxypeptidase regulatory-like domain